MTDSATSLTPAPMEGHGVYNRSSRVQAAGLSPAVPLLEQAAKSVPLPAGPDPVFLVDYGSSEGHNSLGPLATAVRVLRERLGPERAISVVHTDLPDNDFTALFGTVAADPNSYLRRESRSIHPCGRKIVLRADPSGRQCHLGLEFLGGPMAELVCRRLSPIRYRLPTVATPPRVRHSASRRPLIGGHSSPIAGANSAQGGGLSC